MLGIASLVMTCCLLGLSSGMVAVQEGYKNINVFYPQYKGMKVDEVKAKLLEELHDVEFVELDHALPSEFYYGKVGLVVKDGEVTEEPHYFASKKIVEDWTPYIGRPYEVVMAELLNQEGLDGVKFLMQFDNNGKTLYDNRSGLIPFVVLRVNEHGDIQPPKERPERAIV